MGGILAIFKDSEILVNNMAHDMKSLGSKMPVGLVFFFQTTENMNLTSGSALGKIAL